eukprot:gene1674-33068_t
MCSTGQRSSLAGALPSVGGAHGPLALLLITLLVLGGSVSGSDIAIQVHGSGSFTVAEYLSELAHKKIWTAARVPVLLTYRATGTVEAQAEFLTVGDGPLNTTQWTQLSTGSNLEVTGGVMQIPFGITSIGVFHNQQVPKQLLALNACLLAGIYEGYITMWSDADLAVANNWNSALPILGKPIIAYAYAGEHTDENSPLPVVGKPMIAYAYAVEHMNTLTFTKYLQKGCPAVWERGIGSGVQFADAIHTTFQEVALPSGSQVLMSAQADIRGTVSQLVKNMATPSSPDKFTNDWSTMDVTSIVGEKTWPMIDILYFYVFKNLSSAGLSGPLTRQLISMVLSVDGQNMLASHGVAKIPDNLLSLSRAATSLLTTAPDSPSWVLESQDVFQPQGVGLYVGPGVGLYVGLYVAPGVGLDVGLYVGLRVGLGVGLDVGLGVGLDVVNRLSEVGNFKAVVVTDIANVFSQGLLSLTQYCTTLLRITPEDMYARVYSNRAYLTLMPVVPGSRSQASFILADAPLSRDQWTSLGVGRVQPLQMPFLVRPVSIIYKGDRQLTFSPCTLGRVFSGEIKMWNHPLIQGENPGVAIPANQLFILYGADGGADVTEPPVPNFPPQSEGETVPAYSVIKALAGCACHPGAAGSYAKEASFGLSCGREVPTGAYSSLLDAMLSPAISRSLQECTSVTPIVTEDWSNFSMSLLAEFIILGADQRANGRTGGAIPGALQYLIGTWQRSSDLTRYAPALNPLGPVGAVMANSQFLGSIQLHPAAVAWPVLDSSVGLMTTTPAFITSFARHNYLTDLSQLEPQVYLYTIPELQQRLVRLEDDHDKLQAAYGIAIAALVLSVTLPAILLLAYMLLGRTATSKSSPPSGQNPSPGSCFTGGQSEVYKPMEEGILPNGVPSAPI